MLLGCIWSSGGDLHWSILQQRAVIHGSTSVQKVPDLGGPGANVRSARLQVCRNHHIFLSCTVGFKTPVETRRVATTAHQQSWRLKEHTLMFKLPFFTGL